MLTTWDLLQLDFVHSALIAAFFLALAAGLMGPLIIMRKSAFAVHGSSELALTGAAAALIIGRSISTGALIAAVIAGFIFGLLGLYAKDLDSVIGVILGFGLGLAVLFLHLYKGQSSDALSLLTGQIVSINFSDLKVLIAVCSFAIIAVSLIYRPLIFTTIDPVMAHTRGIPVRTLSILFTMLIGLVAAEAVQIVGTLLVLSLLITPAASAERVSKSIPGTIVLSTLFSLISALGGIVLSLKPGLPVSVPVAGLSFSIYLICRIISAVRR